MYKILFIDELPEDIRRFQRYIASKDLANQFEVIVMEPEENFQNFIKKILELNVDAFVSDYMLSEYASNITYTGVDLVEAFLEHKVGFPCFVITSFDDSAVKASSDVNIVYIKALLDSRAEENLRITFLERVENQINHYKNRIEKASTELKRLIDKSRSSVLTASDEERLLELDNFIEKSTDKSSGIPSVLKKNEHLEKIYKLIDNTDELIKKIKKDNQ